MTYHDNSINLERVCRSALGVDTRGALYGMVDADFIDGVGNALPVIAMSLAPYYKFSSREDRQLIENFLESFSHLGHDDYDKLEYSLEVGRAAKELRELIKKL